MLSFITNLPIRHVLIAVIVVIAGLLLIGTLLLARRMRRNAQFEKLQQRWQEIQKLCAKSQTWPLAVINADTLVGDALKITGFKGKTVGERLVSAQRVFSDNDGIWFGHKLRNKLIQENAPKVTKREVQQALKGLRQALTDLGVLS
jgi:hypothetical protein